MKYYCGEDRLTLKEDAVNEGVTYCSWIHEYKDCKECAYLRTEQ